MTWVESIYIFREPVLTVVWIQVPDCLKEYECFKIRENKIILTDLFLFLICTMCQALYNVIFLILVEILKHWYYHPHVIGSVAQNLSMICFKVCSANKALAMGFQPAVIEHRLLNALHCNRRCGRSGGYIIPWFFQQSVVSASILILKWHGGWWNDAHAAWRALVSYFGLSVWV